MKKIRILFIAAFTLSMNTSAQQVSDNNSIKFFLSQPDIQSRNAALPSAVRDRIFTKFSQLINKTGVAEVGYSTFLISPKLDVINVSEDNAGMSKVFVAECELSILVFRTGVGGNSGNAVFNSTSKSVIGSGSSSNDAIVNALQQVSATDPKIVAFLTDTKEMIRAYFKVHCRDVMIEADQALGLGNYQQSLALYLSVPSDASCYPMAVERSQGILVKYIEEQCAKKILSLKSYVALAQKDTAYYTRIMEQFNDLSPYSKDCLREANAIIAKIEGRLSVEQKHDWELKKIQYEADASDKRMQEREMRKAKEWYPGAPAQVNNITNNNNN